MTPSDLRREAESILSRLCAELDEARIQRAIDEPVDKAAGSFMYEPKEPLTYKDIHRILAQFVAHIYRAGLHSDWIIADPLAETLLLLDTYYQGAWAHGYAAAMLEAASGAAEGIDMVLKRLKEIIKTVEREKYVRGVLTRYLGGGPWRLHCEIARLLLHAYRPWLPAALQGCRPEQMVDDLGPLLSVILNSLTTLRDMAGPAPEHPAP